MDNDKLKKGEHIIATSKDGHCRIEGIVDEVGDTAVFIKTSIGTRVCRFEYFAFRRCGR